MTRYQVNFYVLTHGGRKHISSHVMTQAEYEAHAERNSLRVDVVRIA